MSATPLATDTPIDTARLAVARAVGVSAFLYGYPLIEALRTCRLQTNKADSDAAKSDYRAMDSLHHTTRAFTDQDRDIVTPANDLLYSTGWINLENGPRLLKVPSAAAHPGRYFVLALYDAYTENFNNLGPRNCAAAGETIVLVGPSGWPADQLPTGLRVVQCPTPLVWLIGRVLVGNEADFPAAQALQAEISISALEGSGPSSSPNSVANWCGQPVDTMATVFERGEPAAPAAAAFFTNLCHALVDAPGRLQDQGMIAWFAQAGLRPDSDFEWNHLAPHQRQGLTEGLIEAATLIGTQSRHRHSRPWVLANQAGRYGNNYFVRAITAYIGLGALATDEALYGAGHFDAACEPLDGRHHYSLRFEPGELPPADAFWSVTLYDADRFLCANPIQRYAIGDRTENLKWEADGALCIDFSHQEPADPANWLPTPAGNFYLIVRIYHPRANTRGWRIPALQRRA